METNKKKNSKKRYYPHNKNKKNKYKAKKHSVGDIERRFNTEFNKVIRELDRGTAKDTNKDLKNETKALETKELYDKEVLSQMKTIVQEIQGQFLKINVKLDQLTNLLVRAAKK